MSGFTDNLGAFFKGLTLGQKSALAAVIIGAVTLLAVVALWANRPDYALLFANLSSSDASKIVESLQSDGVRYQLRDSGTSVYVPRQDVYELRLRFAGEGVVSDGPVGYELFDGGTLGMTDFMQKLNLRRALEGELARTISAIRQVEIARVHLVIPERSPFRETQTQASASVVLKTTGTTRLSAEQIEGITSLVAGAVEGMDASQVTVLDARGNMLSNPSRVQGDQLETSNQLRHQRAIETHLTEKGQTMLDQMLGPGNALVRVSAALDFTRSISERDLIDPESATIVSEERLDEQGAEDAAATSSVRNFEMSRTRERSEKSVGDVSYLTVSVILNYKRQPGEDDAPVQQVPYEAAEIQEIEALVRNAVGFNTARGDQITTHQTRFDTSFDERLANEMVEQRREERMQLLLRYGLMLLAILAAVWLILSATRRVTKAVEGRQTIMLDEPLRARPVEGRRQKKTDPSRLEEADEEEEFMLVDDVYTSKLSPEAKARLKAKHVMFEEIKSQVVAHPEDTAELFRSWMAEDVSKS
ncbi:MAG: flagellar basal-body MS-ring/collar protein FliF [Bacteroidota bacterium]